MIVQRVDEIRSSRSFNDEAVLAAVRDTPQLTAIWCSRGFVACTMVRSVSELPEGATRPYIVIRKMIGRKL
jgi:hypothetical protein